MRGPGVDGRPSLQIVGSESAGGVPWHHLRVRPRFHVPGLSPDAPAVILDLEQSHHLARVLRLRPGEAVRVFDGAGREFEGLVERADGRAAVVSALHEVRAAEESPVRLTVIAAVLRGATMDALVYDAVMIGAARVVPVLSERVSVPRRGEALRAAHARWLRVGVAACRQCGRATVPEIVVPGPIDAAVAGETSAVRLWLVEPTIGLDAARRVDEFAAPARAGGAALAIGPEGGWSPAEIDLAAGAGFVPWTLGPLVLRAESVPLAACAALRYAWG